MPGFHRNASTRPHSVATDSVVVMLLLQTLFVASPRCGRTWADQHETTERSEVVDVRLIYNRGIGQLEGDLSEAETLLTQARSEARTDGEVRYRATYNLGWVEVNRADELIEEQPQRALEHLQRAAGWFRDAIRLRKDSADARHNLEVILLRILRLRDQLSQQDERDLAAKLDELIAVQRSSIANLRVLVEQIGSSDDPNVADRFRSQFRKLAVDQRVALSDLQELTDEAATELETLENKSDSERSPEENVRVAQLAGVLSYLNQASQRIGQSRSQLRRRQASRGFRRAAMGLSQLKRARDQLRGPLEVLDGIVTDAQATAQQTALMTLDRQIVTDGENESSIPDWLDQDYLTESQADLTQRTEELTTRLATGLQNAKADADQPSPPDGATADDAAAQQEFLDRLRLAMPHLQEATEAMKTADQELALPEYAAAGQQQLRAIKSLQEAREQFADLRALIELAYTTESSIAEALDAVLQSEVRVDGESGDAEGEQQQSNLEPVVGFVTEVQAKNLERMERLKNEIQKEISRLQPMQPTQPSPDPNTSSEPSPQSQQRQRLEIASQLTLRATEQMSAVDAGLRTPEPTQPSPSDDESVTADTNQPPIADWDTASRSAAAAVETLQELRRLFFSIIEHLQETAQRQAELNDETEQLAGTVGNNQAEAQSQQETSEELASRQDQLATVSEQIADALQQQADQPVAADGQTTNVDPQQQAMISQNAEKAGKAAGLVAEATEKMSRASEQLAADEPAISQARPLQDEALQKLVEALQQLQPPRQDPSEQQQDQQQQEQQPQSQTSDEEQQDEQKSKQDAEMDPTRVLQAVRDREAQRQRDRDKRRRASEVPVEKDW